MRVQVDPDRCHGHARCLALAEAYFDYGDEDGLAVAADRDIAPEDVDAITAAVNSCPERAISIVDSGIEH